MYNSVHLGGANDTQDGRQNSSKLSGRSHQDQIFLKSEHGHEGTGRSKLGDLNIFEKS